MGPCLSGFRQTGEVWDPWSNTIGRGLKNPLAGVCALCEAYRKNVGRCGRAEPVQTCGAGEDSLIKQAGQTFCHVLFRVSSAHRVYSISFSVGATLASASIRGIFVKAQVSEFSRPGGSDFYVCSVVFSS